MLVRHPGRITNEPVNFGNLLDEAIVAVCYDTAGESETGQEDENHVLNFRSFFQMIKLIMLTYLNLVDTGQIHWLMPSAVPLEKFEGGWKIDCSLPARVFFDFFGTIGQKIIANFGNIGLFLPPLIRAVWEFRRIFEDIIK